MPLMTSSVEDGALGRSSKDTGKGLQKSMEDAPVLIGKSTKINYKWARSIAMYKQ